MRISGLTPFVPDSPRVLILGSMPSVASLDAGFYYAHPQNRFFKILSRLSGCELTDVESKKSVLRKMHIALFDVIASCEREGSLDSSIKNVIPNDIAEFSRKYPTLKLVITNGGLSKKLFIKYDLQNMPKGIEIRHLPSTSPANAAYSLDRLYKIYQEVLVDK